MAHADHNEVTQLDLQELPVRSPANQQANKGGASAVAVVTTIDRFFVVDKLGEGGMGCVYAAYDPVLGRKLAIKVVQTKQFSPALAAVENQRLIHEAKAMARLSHPNVVSVYDVGSTASGVYLAMELIAGQSLDAWLRSTSRPIREILAAFRQAGEGLAAAHHQGLVHCDFKPSNVMVGQDGRICVCDFGLAQRLIRKKDTVDPSSNNAPNFAATEEGSNLGGTPVYMAPEQMRGEITTDRSDQYSFCVALYKALFGQLPFDGITFDALLQAKVKSAPDFAPMPRRLPKAVLHALARGLASDPLQRYPTMTDLLVDLQPPNVVMQRRWIVGATFGLVLTWAGVQSLAPPTSPFCQGLDAMQEIWTRQARERAEAAFLATRLPYAKASWDLVSRKMDSDRQGWLDTYQHACENRPQIATTAAAGRFDRQMACLGQHRRELQALTQAFVQADATTVLHANRATASRRPVEDCLVDMDSPDIPRFSSSPDRDHALQAALTQVQTQVGLGHYIEAIVQATPLLSRMREARDDWGLAQLGLVLAIANNHLLHVERAREASQLAFTAAIRGGAGRSAAQAAVEWLFIEAMFQPDSPEVVQLRRHTQAQVARLTSKKEVQGLFLKHQAISHALVGNLPAALNLFERSLEAFELAEGSRSLHSVMARHDLGFARVQAGDTALGLTILERSLRELEQLFGHEHPEVAWVMGNLGLSGALTGKPRQATYWANQTRQSYEAMVGADDHVMIIGRLAGVNAAMESGDFTLALEQARLGWQLRTRELGDHHPYSVQFAAMVADMLVATGQWEAARDHLKTLALHVPADRVLVDDLDTLPTHLSMASAFLALADHDAARLYLAAAVQALPALPHSGPDTRAGLLHCRAAWIALGLGQVEQARELVARLASPTEAFAAGSNFAYRRLHLIHAKINRQDNRLDQAQAHARAAFEVTREELGEASPLLVTPLHELAHNDLLRGQPARALEWLAQAQAIAETSPDVPSVVVGELEHLRALAWQRVDDSLHSLEQSRLAGARALAIYRLEVTITHENLQRLQREQAPNNGSLR